MSETQESFKKKYITSTEMVAFLGISRTGFLYGRRSGKIKAAPISSENRNTFIWERAAVYADLLAWKASIDQRQAA